ncbi:UDP-glucose 4-epimerase GalE [Cereibacter sphaeroides]|uniref:UDP-glucose 4-epimerase GalE n=1 Tax=Cereibacter sphaeroides TaxID=1063 RepID=UPI000E5BA21C|nr:UDP-glucose 4-epimerase GalE [Cereibacter sphaeroides]AZB62927.1 UDP-glucose 4-epimerase GalE [Cereibacter sphaeroides]AZB69115.1 UDP-glucose 4-epimerase GalE [Cereibacter sphaeroides]RIA01477.1 UDP-glucose 4-epimerase GalE [Cereibacter sphaeroides]
MAQRVLVTGGAGYIGSHACKVLKRAGFEPVTFDNLSTGWEQAVKFGPLARGDLMDRASIDAALETWKPVAVMHFAALSLVGESMRDPGTYWRVNVTGALNLLEATVAAGVKNFVFSSTCATYGDQDGVVLDEDTPQRPINAYGASKRAIEEMVANFGAAFGLNHTIFRYFNVAGADPEGEVGEQHDPETHLIPLMLDAVAGRRPALTVFGTDYPTRDGTCIRDYVHVMDLAHAHVLGLNRLLDGGPNRVFCLGTGRGFSVREVIEQSRAVTNREVPILFGDRRSGDAAALVCGSERAVRELGWEPELSTLPHMIADAWRWHQAPKFHE